MKFKLSLKDLLRKKPKEELSPLKLEEELSAEVAEVRKARIAEGVPKRRIPRGYKVVETYPLNEPWAYAVIAQNPETGETRYVVDEIPLTPQEQRIYEQIINVLYWEMRPPREDEDPREYFAREAKCVIRKYRIRLGRMPGVSWAKILYYVERNTLGFGPIDPIMKDPYVEDISCDGVGKPIYVWHRRYESIPTNIVFTSDRELDEMIMKLAHKAGKHVSVAFPIVDAILPGGHRLAATFKREVSTKGSTFTIRKFREDPITIVDMINFGTVSPGLAAYFWLAMEFKMTSLIMGVTGSGKTTTLNALACMFRPTIKVVTIEDTPELKLPLENWVQLVSRPSYGLGPERVGEITLFDLVKVSLRYRPDVIIVGEVRGEEAYVLFQAIATGHGGMTTLHAENIDAAVKRLTSPPMNIPKSYIPLINVAAVIKRVRLYNPDGTYRIARRITEVYEVRDYGDYPMVAKWDPVEDKHKVNIEESVVLRKICEEIGRDISWAVEEVAKRSTVLKWMAVKGIRKYTEVAAVIQKYYASPKEVYERAVSELKSMKRA